MSQPSRRLRTELDLEPTSDRVVRADQTPATLAEALDRMDEAEDTLRAIAKGEVDAFVVSDAVAGRRVFALSTADRPYRSFVENMRDGAATVSSTGIIRYANQRLAELLSRPREEIVGSPLAMFLSGDPSGLEKMKVPGRVGVSVESALVDSNGEAVPVLLGFSPPDVEGDRLTCVTFTELSRPTAQDREILRLSDAQAARMVELHEAQAALTKQATHDALTGLPNRTLLVDRIERALSHSKRSGLCTAIFFVDLDRFKQVNDTQGHAAGDTVLRRVAEQLTAVLRPMDTVAHIGGDEFVVLAPDVDSHLHAVDIASRVVGELCRRPDRVEDGERISASVGISVSIGGRGTAETLLNEADTAMYQAKTRGGARAEVFDAALGRQVRQRSIAQRLLQSALDDRRIIVYYQPVVDLPSGHVAGFEALARIAAHDGSILAPASFISVAEDSGLVVPLGSQVLALACQEACCWQPKGIAAGPLTIAVNLSARQFEPGDLTSIVRTKLMQSGLNPEFLHLELTETAIIDLRPDILEQLGLIRDLGVQIGLDDFGTGYASLTHLRRLPLSFVKIDQSFVQGIGTDRSDEQIMSAVVDLAGNLGLRSIAEGVETQEQLDRLRELGCDQAQGYLFARPMSPNDVPITLEHAAW